MLVVPAITLNSVMERGRRVQELMLGIERIAGGITNPFEVRFKPLIADIKDGRAKLEELAAVASRECRLKPIAITL